MTQPAAPPNSGLPSPVAGVTGGPPVLGGQISNDPTDGSVIIAPNPGNVLQLRKGSQPQGLQIYERFDTNTNYTRLGLYAQTNGPFRIVTEFQGGVPNGTRQLNIESGTGTHFIVAGNDCVRMSPSVPVQIVGNTDDASSYALQINNHSITQNNVLVRNDGVVSLGQGIVTIQPPTVGTPALQVNGNATIAGAGTLLITGSATLQIASGGLIIAGPGSTVNFSGANVNPNLYYAQITTGAMSGYVAAAWADVPGSSFSITNAGVYLIEVETIFSTSSTAVAVAIGIATSTNTLVVTSLGQMTIAAGQNALCHGMSIITMPVGTYKIQQFTNLTTGLSSASSRAFAARIA